jgi:predicted O-linked N-acetylglucosamine transferase (SPINDLY family)
MQHQSGAVPEHAVSPLLDETPMGAVDSGAPDAAVLNQAAEGDLSLAGLIDLTSDWDRTGGSDRMNRIDALYRTWLAYNSQHPLAYAARFNYAVLLAQRGALRQARDMLLAALAQKPDFAPACINLGSVLERADDRLGAVAAWQRITLRLPQIDGESVGFKTTALNQIGRVFEAARVEAPAEAAMAASLDIDPSQHEVIQHMVALRQAQCVWPVLQERPRLSAAAQLEAISPLSLAAQLDDPILQLANAYRYHMRDGQIAGIGTVGQWPPPAEAAPKRLRIGYVSSDLREHAVGYLMVRMFALHDRSRVEIFAYYCGAAREDALKAQFRAEADQWRDISALTDRDAAAQIVRDGIDILVDVNGYTKDARVRLFGLRPAPILVNWLGFPGTLGSPHHHYIVADRNIIPPEDEIFYAETVRRLPCYQPNDGTRPVAAVGQTRAQAGLPETGFVFCGFNGPHKLTPDMFALWMDILRDTPGSVLWLLCDSDETRARLHGHAEAAGIASARLIFAGRMANAEHLARYRLADVFLDTAPYGAHTTASDALWMGVPVLTRAGNCFAARVCASLVREAGIPELVCRDRAAYRALAGKLAQSPALLVRMRAQLAAARHSCAAFDTKLLVRSIEGLFEAMWRDYCADALPRPRLDHLPLYHRLGNDPARPALPDRKTLLDWYRTALAYEDSVRSLPADPLLWPEVAAAQRAR